MKEICSVAHYNTISDWNRRETRILWKNHVGIWSCAWNLGEEKKEFTRTRVTAVDERWCVKSEKPIILAINRDTLEETDRCATETRLWLNNKAEHHWLFLFPDSGPVAPPQKKNESDQDMWYVTMRSWWNENRSLLYEINESAAPAIGVWEPCIEDGLLVLAAVDVMRLRQEIGLHFLRNVCCDFGIIFRRKEDRVFFNSKDIMEEKSKEKER